MNHESVLLPQHRKHFTQRPGIALEVMTPRGYRSIQGPEGYTR
jgi:hypothetical protein